MDPYTIAMIVGIGMQMYNSKKAGDQAQEESRKSSAVDRINASGNIGNDDPMANLMIDYDKEETGGIYA